MTATILLPPSEGKSSGGDGSPLDLSSLSFPGLEKQRELFVGALTKLGSKPRVAGRLLGVKGKALEQAMEENSAVSDSATTQAIKRYTGVMYDAIEYESLSAEARNVFDESVVIFSGLFGLITPGNLIPAYKLKMSAKLRANKASALHWRKPITDSLKSRVRGQVLWDLLPNEHSNAWDPYATGYEHRFTTKFLERKSDGQLKTVSHWSKALKGLLVRHIVENIAEASEVESAKRLAQQFSHPEGYEYSAEHSTTVDRETEIIYLKN